VSPAAFGHRAGYGDPRPGPSHHPGNPPYPDSGPPRGFEGVPRSSGLDGGGVSGRRSHWVDERGIDQRGRRVVEADDQDDWDPVAEAGATAKRRLAVLGLLGVAGGAYLGLSPQGLDLARKIFGGDDGATPNAGPPPPADGLSHDDLPGDGSDRPAGKQPSQARTYAEQDDSYMGSTAGDKMRKNTPRAGKVFTGPAAAAAAAKVVVETVLAVDPVRHLASRLTFGPTPRLLADIRKVGIDAWISAQLDPAKIPETRAEKKLAAELTTLGRSIAELRDGQEVNNKAGIRPDEEAVEAAIARQVWSDRQVFEVMVDFWNDFLHVAAFFEGAEVLRPSFDRDVIRRYALDNYPDMLVAANRHPALLRYLDQDQSRKDAVNENLARENLELYSVGVDGGYTEKDVRQAALLQTGRGIRDGQYVYRADQHYVGPVEIMGFKHANGTPEGGEKAADQYFRYLALHPSTARYIATNLATRLVSDTPPKALVDRVTASYLKNKGQVKPTLITLLSSTEFWSAVGQKARRPMEYIAATYRTLGVQADTPATFPDNEPMASPFLRGLREIRRKLEQLGHFPTGMPTPNGYPDVHVAWTSAGTMINLWNETMSIVEGRRAMFTYVAPERILGTTPPATAGAYVDALARRLLHQPLSARERNLVLGVADVAATDRVDATFNGAIRAVIRTILASPQHYLR
jgi:uncharacterized protein (DUF1800 family)